MQPVDNAGMFGTPGRDHVPVANALLGVWRDDYGSVASTTASAAQTFTGMPRPSLLPKQYDLGLPHVIVLLLPCLLLCSVCML